MNYLNELTNVYTQLYRKPRYTQIGGTRVYEPMRINLDQMYGPRYAPQQLPGAPTPPTYTPPVPEQPVPTVGMRLGEEYPEQAGWQKWTTLQGAEAWMPVREGDIYTDNLGNKWYYSQSLGKWLQTKWDIDEDLGIRKLIIDPENQPFAGLNQLGNYAGKTLRWEAVGVTPENQYEALKSQYETVSENYETTVDDVLLKAFRAQGIEHWITGLNPNIPEDAPIRRTINRIVNNVRNYIANLEFKGKSLEGVIGDLKDIFGKEGWGRSRRSQLAAAILDNSESLVGLKEQIEGLKEPIERLEEQISYFESLPKEDIGQEIGVGEIKSWSESYQELLEGIESGEITYLNEQGNLDLTQLRNMGIMGNWFADVLENSYKTGVIGGNIIQYNEETGEYELAPELQEMENYIGFQSPEVQEQWREYNRQLALNAIAAGHSLNSGFYSEHAANVIAEYSANVTNQVAQTMMGEIEAQYNYIANSLKQSLVELGVITDGEAFMADMATQWEANQEQYRQQIEALAMEVAETEAARFGDILTSVLTFAAQIAIAAIL